MGVWSLSPISGFIRFPGGGNGKLLQYSCLKNSRQRSLLGYIPWGYRVGNEWTHTHAARVPNLWDLIPDGLRWRLCNQFSSVQLLSQIQLSATPWTEAYQASLSIINSRSLLKLMSIASVMPSNHIILCHPFLLLPSVFPIIRAFSNESALCIRFLPYIIMNQTQIYIKSPSSWTSLPSPTPSHPSRLAQSPGLCSLSHTANSLSFYKW